MNIIIFPRHFLAKFVHQQKKDSLKIHILSQSADEIQTKWPRTGFLVHNTVKGEEESILAV